MFFSQEETYAATTTHATRFGSWAQQSQQVWAADNDHVGFTFVGWLPFKHMSPLGFTRFFQGDGASFHIRESGGGFGCDSVRVVEDPIPLPSVGFPLRFDQIDGRINRYEVTVAASYLPDLRLVGSCTTITSRGGM